MIICSQGSQFCLACFLPRENKVLVVVFSFLNKREGYYITFLFYPPKREIDTCLFSDFICILSWQEKLFPQISQLAKDTDIFLMRLPDTNSYAKASVQIAISLKSGLQVIPTSKAVSSSIIQRTGY